MPKVEWETVGFGWTGTSKKTRKTYIRLSFMPEMIGMMKPDDLEKKMYLFKRESKEAPSHVIKAPIAIKKRKEESEPSNSE